MDFKRNFFLATVLACFYTATANAAVEAPGGLSSNEIQKNFQNSILKPLPGMHTPKVTRGILLPSNSKAYLMGRKPFVLKNVAIQYTTVYARHALIPVYKNYIGKKINNADIDDIVNAVKNYYVREGFILTDVEVPKQSFTNGTLVINISRGIITETSVNADDPKVAALMEKYAKTVKNIPCFNRSTLEYYNTLLNTFPGLSAYLVLTPIAGEPGHYKLSFIGKQRHYTPLVNINNNGSRYYGRELIYLGNTFASIFNAGDALNLILGTSNEPRRLKYGRLSYELPLNMQGTRLSFYTSFSATDPDLGFVSQINNTSTEGMTLSQPLFLDIYNKWYAYGTLESTNTRLSTFIPNYFYTFGKQDYRSLRLGTTYIWGDPTRALNQLKAEISQGLDIDSQQTLDNSILYYPPGDLQYTKVNFSASSRENLGYNFSSKIAMSAQYSPDRLVQNEKFTYGGTEFGLGYDPGELEGDTGADASLEIDYNQATHYAFLKSVQYFTYYDFGITTNHDPFLGGKETGASAGAGLRFGFTKTLSGSVEVDKPLTHKLNSSLANGGEGRPWRTFFSLQYVPERFQ